MDLRFVLHSGPHLEMVHLVPPEKTSMEENTSLNTLNKFNKIYCMNSIKSKPTRSMDSFETFSLSLPFSSLSSLSFFFLPPLSSFARPLLFRRFFLSFSLPSFSPLFLSSLSPLSFLSLFQWKERKRDTEAEREKFGCNRIKKRTSCRPLSSSTPQAEPTIGTLSRHGQRSA